MVFIEIITGKAGCGKSFLLSKYINNVASKTSDWVVLSYTHSAVKNIKGYVQTNYPNINTAEHFKTFHKFFHINYYNTVINTNYAWEYLDYMFIDEFSLLSIHLFLSAWPIIKNYVGKLVLVGDYRQLKPVDSSCKISYDNLRKYMDILPIGVNELDVIKHIDNLVISLDVVKNNIKRFVNLTQQHRANNDVNKLIESLCFQQSSSTCLDDYIVKLSSVINLVSNNGYVFIASTYKQLEHINKLIEQNNTNIIVIENSLTTIDNIPRVIYVKIGGMIRITETYDDNQNGDIYVLAEVCDKYLLVKHVNTDDYKQLFPIITNDGFYYPILPTYLLTFHKSQGLTIDNVIVSLDNIFDFTMLYTGISRTRNNVLFYSESTIDYTLFDNIRHNYSVLDQIINKMYSLLLTH